MNSTESGTNNQYQYEQNKNEENKEELLKRPEPRSTVINPSFIYPQILNPQKSNISNASEKNNMIGECFNSFCSYKSLGDNYPINKPLLSNYKNFNPIIPPWKFPSFGVFNSNLRDEQKNRIRIDSNNFMLNYLSKENDDFYKEKKENKNYPNLFQFQNKNYDNKWAFNNNLNRNISGEIDINNKINQTQIPINIPKIINNEINSPKTNDNINTNANSGTKFFTNHNYGYKCSCSKTQCNRKYCECYNSGNYCVDCNCKNCNNKPPINSYTNKHPTDEQTKIKKERIICTCTKSGCNKNYCECFKIGQKCSSLCRCIGCENNDQIQNKKYNYNYQCNLANSIFIIKNKLYIEDINLKREELRKKEFIGNNKKRRREEKNNEEEELHNNNKNKKIEDTSDDVNLFNDSLFDKNGKVILRHINLFHI